MPRSRGQSNSPLGVVITALFNILLCITGETATQPLVLQALSSTDMGSSTKMVSTLIQTVQRSAMAATHDSFDGMHGGDWVGYVRRRKNSMMLDKRRQRKRRKSVRCDGLDKDHERRKKCEVDNEDDDVVVKNIEIRWNVFIREIESKSSSLPAPLVHFPLDDEDEDFFFTYACGVVRYAQVQAGALSSDEITFCPSTAHDSHATADTKCEIVSATPIEILDNVTYSTTARVPFSIRRVYGVKVGISHSVKVLVASNLKEESVYTEMVQLSGKMREQWAEFENASSWFSKWDATTGVKVESLMKSNAAALASKPERQRRLLKRLRVVDLHPMKSVTVPDAPNFKNHSSQERGLSSRALPFRPSNESHILYRRVQTSVAEETGASSAAKDDSGDDIGGRSGGVSSTSITLIAAIAGGATAFVLAFVFVIWLCRGRCCSSSRKDRTRPKEKLSQAVDETNVRDDKRSRNAAVSSSSNRMKFPVPAVIVDMDGTESHSLDDTTLEGRSLGNMFGSKSTTPTTTSTISPRSDAFSKNGSPYPKIESSPSLKDTDARGWNDRAGGDDGGTMVKGNSQESKSKTYVSVEKRCVTQESFDDDFVSPFHGENREVEFGTQFGDAPENSGGIGFDDTTEFSADDTGFTRTDISTRSLHRTFVSKKQDSDHWGTPQNTAWASTTLPSSPSVVVPLEKDNFHESPEQSSFIDNIELTLEQYDDNDVSAEASPFVETKRRDTDVGAADDRDSKVKDKNGGDIGPTQSLEQLKQQDSFMADYWNDGKEGLEDLANVPDPEDFYLDDHETSSSSSDDIPFENVGGVTGAEYVEEGGRREASSAGNIITSPRSPSAASSASGNKSFSSSVGMKKKGDYGPDLSSRANNPESFGRTPVKGVRSSGEIADSNRFEMDDMEGVDLRHPDDKSPVKELTVKSEAGVSSLGTRSTVDGQMQVNMQTVTAAAATAASSNFGQSSAAAKAKQRLQQSSHNTSTPKKKVTANGNGSGHGVTLDEEKKDYMPDSDDSSMSSKNENDFLFEAVTNTLGPRGVAADMESLSGMSHRSGGLSMASRNYRNRQRSQGGKYGRTSTDIESVGSNNKKGRVQMATNGRSSAERSVGSRQSRQRSRRRSRSAARRPQKSSDKSVGSRDSRVRPRRTRSSSVSAGSRGSRSTSHFSTKSGSVAAELLRLEGKLEGLNGPGGRTTDSGSVVSARSRISVSSTASAARRKGYGSTTLAPIRLEIVAPPGRLGIILQNRTPENRGTIVSDVRTTSPLHGEITSGDRIVRIDDEDVSQMSVAEITAIMARKSEVHRTLTVITRRGARESTSNGYHEPSHSIEER